MKIIVAFVVATLLSGCSMTPTQKKWATIGATVVVTGMIIAHQQDNGAPVAQGAASTNGKRGPFHPCPSGNPQECK
jgi:uncharacterized protein YceK